MLQAKHGGLEGDARSLVDVVKDPSAEGGVRYVDPKDGEDLGRYGTECTARTPTVQRSLLSGPTEGERDDEGAFQELYDGLTYADNAMLDAAPERALAACDKLKAAIAMDLVSNRDWGEEWHKIRETPSIRRALRYHSMGAARDSGPAWRGFLLRARHRYLR